jgi:hypothetical protein
MNAKGHPSKPKQWSPFAPDATALNHVQSRSTTSNRPSHAPPATASVKQGHGP